MCFEFIPRSIFARTGDSLFSSVESVRSVDSEQNLVTLCAACAAAVHHG